MPTPTLFRIPRRMASAAALSLAALGCSGAFAQSPPGTAPGAAARVPCDVEKVKSQLKGTASQGLLNSLASTIFSSNCGSVGSVMAQLGGSQTAGGRKLEPDRAFDQAAAERELAQARAEADYAAELASETQGESHPMRRLLLEAAMLDDRGLYKARDLLLRQIRQGAGQ